MTIKVLDINPDPNDKVFGVLVKLFAPFFDDGTSDDFVKEEVEWHPKYGREIIEHEILLIHPTFVKKGQI
jgi:hypothetical protein